MRTRTFLVFAAAAGACALLSGCSTSSPGASSDGDQTARATVTPDGDNVLAAFAGISSDYDAVETGPDLAEISEAEVVGTIRSVSEGRVAAVVGTDDVLSHSIVVEIAPDQVFSGSEVQTLRLRLRGAQQSRGQERFRVCRCAAARRTGDGLHRARVGRKCANGCRPGASESRCRATDRRTAVCADVAAGVCDRGELRRRRLAPPRRDARRRPERLLPDGSALLAQR